MNNNLNDLNKFINNGNPIQQGGNQNMISQLMQFAKQFNGNPQQAEQEVMKILSNNPNAQNQFNGIVQQANQIMNILKQFGIK